MREYGYVRGGGLVFPKKNAHLLQIAPGIPLHGAFFNAWHPVIIEEGVGLSHEVAFLTGLHEMGPEGFDPEPGSRGPIRVERGAWIGSRAMILGGVRVGRGSVVGAGAVVTTDIPPHEFWAGNPARHVRLVGQRPGDAETT
jgi:acetyltransferase-like isoleucine patch superfamily enzyme